LGWFPIFQLTVAAAWDTLVVLLEHSWWQWPSPHHMQQGGCLQWTQMWPKRWQFKIVSCHFWTCRPLLWQLYWKGSRSWRYLVTSGFLSEW
jgi:hypothetical protein